MEQNFRIERSSLISAARSKLLLKGKKLKKKQKKDLEPKIHRRKRRRRNY